MKTLYIECSMGAAGDMLMGALYELIDDRQGFLDKMNSLGIPGVRVEAEPSIKCGIAGTHMKVTIEGKEEHQHNHEDGHHHHHDHSSLHSISHMVSHMDIKEETRDKIMKVYRLIAEAEGAVHNRPAGEIHFHEVGSLDAVADIWLSCDCFAYARSPVRWAALVSACLSSVTNSVQISVQVLSQVQSIFLNASQRENP